MSNDKFVLEGHKPFGHRIRILILCFGHGHPTGGAKGGWELEMNFLAKNSFFSRVFLAEN